MDYGQPLGEYMCEINNLVEVINVTYWAFLLRGPQGDCFLPVGKI